MDAIWSIPIFAWIIVPALGIALNVYRIRRDKLHDARRRIGLVR